MTMKNGFSTINRLLGKNRESSSNLSKSTTNLSVTKSTVNINDSSQVHQNRITPLPIATSNAPFEQTFRITVLLPRDQLYVARLGAKVLLHKLLQLVCENKQLDPEKYEFQHPADTSQIFSCDLTIGAVGLSEIRLCNKSEYNNTFRSDDVTSRRNSFSSSKYSRNSKIISNTQSLYSSRNSLNSMSSSGIDSNFRNNTTEVGGPKHLAPVIPVRKKRLAPRPPSQNLSLENDSALRTKTSELPSNTNTTEIQQPIPHTELVSSLNPNHTLEQRISGSNDLIKSNISIDCNGNTKGSLQNNGLCITQCQESSSEAINTTDVVVPKDSFYSQSSIKNISCLSQPEPSPRRKVQTPPKKPIPVAPPRSTKSPTENINETQPEEKMCRDFTMLQEGPVALPRSASSGSLISEPIEQSAVNSKNESEIIINQSPSIESNLILQTPDVKSALVESINSQSKGSVLDDGEEQIDRSWNSLSTQSSAETKHKLFIESSSEDDEMIKVYDLKLGKKTIVKTLSNHKTSEVIDGIKPNIEIVQPRSPPGEDFVKSQNFSDNDSSEKDALLDISVVDEIKKDDFPSPHSSILKDQKVDITVESSQSYISTTKEENQDNSIIEDKLNQQIEEQRITEETNIKCENVAEKPITEVNKEVKGINNIKPEIPSQITQMKQPQKETTLSENKKPTIDPDEMGKQESKVINTTIINSTQAITKQEPLISTLERLVGDEELLDEQNFKLSPIQTKPAIQTKPDLPNRSSSFLSLVQLESTNQRNYTTDEYLRRRRRSSSELSIGESPSLQSIGVIKSILSSRKNSLCGSEESNRTPPTECDIQSMEEPSPKSNNILKTNKLKTVEQEKVYRYSGPPNIHFSTWSERPKVQVSIKNEQDCVFNGSKVFGQNTISTVNRGDLAPQRTNPNLKSAPFVKDLVKNGTEKIALKDTTSNFSSEKEMDKTQNPSTTSTIPKFILGDRTSNPWNVLSTTSITSAHNNRPLSKPLLRSTSMTRTVSTPVIKQTQPAFGQGTLRKTGYKEKIVPLPDTDVDADVSKPIPFALKNQTNPQATPKIVKNTIRTEVPVSNVPDAPPPPPIIRAVVTKQKTNNRTQISLTVDPRDQLLSAIRNFKRDELKNANI